MKIEASDGNAKVAVRGGREKDSTRNGIGEKERQIEKRRNRVAKPEKKK